MKSILVSFIFAFSAFGAHADSFNCSTKFAHFIPTGKLRIAGTRANDSLQTVSAQYFDLRIYRPLAVSINPEYNPDRNYKPRNYKGYLRYVIVGARRGESYELLLPIKIMSSFKAYIVARDFEDKSPRYELLCRGR